MFKPAAQDSLVNKKVQREAQTIKKVEGNPG
jgi:hypothetical protein